MDAACGRAIRCTLATSEVVFRLLKPKHRTTKLETEAGTAYIELLDRAREYFEQRTPETFGRLSCDGLPMPGT